MRPPTWVSQAADRHFPQSKLFSEMLMVETDHDMRNSADFISLDRVARALIRLPGVAMVQSITRPLGRALDHASIPYLFTTQGSGNGQQLPFNRQQNANTDKQAEIQADSVAVLRKEIGFFQKVSDELHQTVLTVENLQKVTDEINDDSLESRRFLPSAQELLLLGDALFRHPHVLGIPFAVRRRLDNIDKSGRRHRATPTPSLQAVDKALPADDRPAESHAPTTREALQA